MEHLKITQNMKIVVVFMLCAAMMLMCVSPGYAVVGTATVVASAVVAAMVAFGVGILVSDMTASQVSAWVNSELNEWAASLNDTVDNLIPVASIAVNPIGSLTLMPATAARIVNFVRWLANKYNVIAGGSAVSAVSTSFGTGQPFLIESTGEKFNLVSFIVNNKTKFIQLYPEKKFEYYCFVSGNTQEDVYITVVTPGDKHTYSCRWYSTNSNGHDYFGAGTYSQNYDLTYWTRAFTIGSYTSYIPEYSSVDAGLSELADYLQTGPQSLILVPEGAIDYPSYVGDDDEELPYVLDWGGSPGLTVDQAAEEILDRVADNDLVSDGSMAVDPDAAVWPDLVYPQTVPSLDQIFPFCIPFDVYHFFQALSAEPTAPHWEVPFVVPGLVNYTFVIDLSEFNNVAQIFRTMELLCFCVGLALITRKIIRG